MRSADDSSRNRQLPSTQQARPHRLSATTTRANRPSSQGVAATPPTAMTGVDVLRVSCMVTRCLHAALQATTQDDQAKAIRAAQYTLLRLLKMVRRG